MDNIAKKEYLLQYSKSEKRIRALREQLFSLQEVEKSAKTQQLSAMPKGSSRNKDLSDFLVRIEKLQEEIENKITESLRIRTEIEEHIIEMENENEALVLRMRYIDLMDWTRISHRMKYSKRHTLRIHKAALENFKDVTPCHF